MYSVSLKKYNESAKLPIYVNDFGKSLFVWFSVVTIFILMFNQIDEYVKENIIFAIESGLIMMFLLEVYNWWEKNGEHKKYRICDIENRIKHNQKFLKAEQEAFSSIFSIGSIILIVMLCMFSEQKQTVCCAILFGLTCRYLSDRDNEMFYAEMIMSKKSLV